jgi:hypothetical protein
MRLMRTQRPRHGVRQSTHHVIAFFPDMIICDLQLVDFVLSKNRTCTMTGRIYLFSFSFSSLISFRTPTKIGNSAPLAGLSQTLRRPSGMGAGPGLQATNPCAPQTSPTYCSQLKTAIHLHVRRRCKLIETQDGDSIGTAVGRDIEFLK